MNQNESAMEVEVPDLFFFFFLNVPDLMQAAFSSLLFYKEELTTPLCSSVIN